MKKYIIIFAAVMASLSVNATEGDATKDELLRQYDFGFLWTSNIVLGHWDTTYTYVRMEPLGYIGDNYQKFDIHFSSVIKNTDSPADYFIYGKTRVNDNICNFQGVIVIDSVIWVADYETVRGVYEMTGRTIKLGRLRGTYAFYEDSESTGSGSFYGSFYSDFFVEDNGKIYYDALWLSLADGYCNNQFEGVWKSYKTGLVKKCNWGDYRIPDSGNLDLGVGEFMPDEKYYRYGWDDYYDTYIVDNNSNRKSEWWK